MSDAPHSGWRRRAYVVIFESDTPAGKAFDVALIAAIAVSIVAVMLESMADVRARHGAALLAVEWGLTALFTLEYGLRLWCSPAPRRYARSFFGLVDLLSILPTYLSVLLPGAQALLVIRTLRILRVFRVLKLAHYVRESEDLMRALAASRRKIAVFLFAVLTMVIVFGAAMYLIEGPENGFSSIPRGMYWAIVTLTTVGYGDIRPQTDLGQALAAAIMVLGYGIIAVPTGIVTAQLTRAQHEPHARRCANCAFERHVEGARHCAGCGAPLTDRA